MKKLIVVQNAYPDLEITKHSIESIRYAAHKWKSNYYEITHFQFPNSPEDVLWDKFWILENFIDYDIVLMIDADCVVNSVAPSIFEELGNDYDFGAVLDGNPNGRFKHNDMWYRSHAYNYHLAHNSVSIFQKYIPNFNYENYWNTYCNMGMFLFRPKIMYGIMQDIKKLLYNNTEIYEYLNYHKNNSRYAGQNLLCAFLSLYKDRFLLMDNTWNWLAPDDVTEYNEEMFLGKMKPYIYHFAGTDGSKESLKTYNRWK